MLKYLSKVLYVLSGSKIKLIFLLLCFIVSSILEVISIGLLNPFINLASEPSLDRLPSFLANAAIKFNLDTVSELLLVFGLVIIAFFCIKSILYFFARSYIIYFSLKQTRTLMSRLMSAYLIVPYEFHLGRNSASLIKNIILECDHFYHFCILPFLNLITNFVVIGFLFVLLAQTNSILLLMILGILLPVFILFNLLGKKIQKWGQIASQSRGEMITIINHGLGGLKETRVIGCEAYFQNLMKEQAYENARVATLFQSSQLLPRVLIETILILFSVLLISISHIAFKQNIQDLTGVIGVFAVASMRLISASSQCIQSINQMQKGSYALNMLYLDLREIEKEKIDNNVQYFKINEKFYPDNFKNQRIEFKKQIELKNLTYRYPGVSENAIDNISLTIKKGQAIALIGKSGAGKTTLVDIILGLLKPGSGDILIDNNSIYDNIRSWQNLVGYIPQSIFLTDDTIERNIAFGVQDSSIDSERLNKAIKAAQLSELVQELPNGIKTKVGERGVRLSGGQRQRVGIARALYHEREILVLDEATAALDNETEKLVNEAIKSLAGTKTLIIIAHRLSTIEHCDLVYVLEKGSVVNSGSYQEVVSVNLSV